MQPLLTFITGFARRHTRQLVLIVATLVAGILLACLLVPGENRAVAEHLLGFPDSDAFAQRARVWVLAFICLIPALGVMFYTLGDTLDRYVTRRFLSMFGICLAALYIIWWLIDITDHMSDFRQSKSMLGTMLAYYGTRLPAVLLLLMPYALLLSLLESLGKLSTNREIIAIIQAGRGVVRITLPLIVAGALCTLFTMALNYHWAPIAEGSQEEILAEASGRTASEASQVLYRNQRTQRLWMVSNFPPDYQKGEPLVGVEVTLTDGNGQLKSRLSASQARWDKASAHWIFDKALWCRYQPGKPPLFERYDEPLVITDWSETPWQIIKPGLSAEYLGIPDLNAWMRTNELHPQMADEAPYRTHWHYRWALPFACLITILLATPLAIHFSRRGAGGEIFLAVALSALMMLTNTVVLAFGESGHLPPVVAAWLPNTIFAAIGLILYHRRIHGRPIYQSLRKWFAPA